MGRDNRLDWRLPGERAMLLAVTANLTDDLPKLVYADWLEERGDDRGQFLRAFVQVAKSMDYTGFLQPIDNLPGEWLSLIGYFMLSEVVFEKVPEIKHRLLRLARPALRMDKSEMSDDAIPTGCSKVGGLPDLPPGFPWVPGGDCHAVCISDTGGTDRLAGFVCQVNFAETGHTVAAKDLPESGLLSFFCFQDIENDEPASIGVKAIYFPSTSKLVRTEPPKSLTEGNGVISPHRLTFEETLDLPEGWSGPWAGELNPNDNKRIGNVLSHFRSVNFENVLGYGRSTTGGDPTPHRDSRHLILLENAAGCRLHIQIDQDDLTACRFDKIRLQWVDFG